MVSVTMRGVVGSFLCVQFVLHSSDSCAVATTACACTTHLAPRLFEVVTREVARSGRNECKRRCVGGGVFESIGRWFEQTWSMR